MNYEKICRTVHKSLVINALKRLHLSKSDYKNTRNVIEMNFDYIKNYCVTNTKYNYIYNCLVRMREENKRLETEISKFKQCQNILKRSRIVLIPRSKTYYEQNPTKEIIVETN